MKNSSRLEPTMATNLSRSKSGVRSSAASCRTRWLNSSQLRSRSSSSGWRLSVDSVMAALGEMGFRPPVRQNIADPGVRQRHDKAPSRLHGFFTDHVYVLHGQFTGV